MARVSQSEALAGRLALQITPVSTLDRGGNLALQIQA